MKRVWLLVGFGLVALSVASPVGAAPSCSVPDSTYKDLLVGLPDEIAAGRSVEFLTNATQQPLELDIVSDPPNLVTGPVLFAWTLTVPQISSQPSITVTAKWPGEDPATGFAACEQSLSRTISIASPTAPVASVEAVPTPQKGDQNTFLNIGIQKECLVGAKGPITMVVTSGGKSARMKLADQCVGKWSRKRKLKLFTLAGGDDYSGNRYLSVRQNGKQPGKRRYKIVVTWQGKRLLTRTVTSVTSYNKKKNRLIRHWKVPE